MLGRESIVHEQNSRPAVLREHLCIEDVAIPRGGDKSTPMKENEDSLTAVSFLGFDESPSYGRRLEPLDSSRGFHRMAVHGFEFRPSHFERVFGIDQSTLHRGHECSVFVAWHRVPSGDPRPLTQDRRGDGDSESREFAN